MLIGLELPEVVTGLRADGIHLGTAILYGIVVTVVLILARMISSYAALVSTLIFRPSVAPGRGNKKRMWRMPLVLGWTGMRGVVSLAAALAIPLTLPNGETFPHRSLILFVTFIVILLTLLLQGLTLPTFIKRSHLFDNLNEEKEEEMKLTIRNRLVTETLRLLKEHEANGEEKDWFLQHMITQWEHKINQPGHLKLSEATKEAYLELLEKQRQFLADLNKDPAIDDEVILEHIYQIDLEEERVKLL
jgi:CPA1 family monovalent cation:H+ antiporter